MEEVTKDWEILFKPYAPWMKKNIDGNIVEFFQPSFRPAGYVNAGKAIIQAGLEVPTGKEMALFLDACYNVPKVINTSEAGNVRKAMLNSWIWDFAKNRYTQTGPENERGIWVVRDEKAEGLIKTLIPSKLIAQLSSRIEVKGVKFSPDYRIAFAPELTYKSKPFNKDNGYLIARGQGEEGAEALIRVSRNNIFIGSGDVSLNNIVESDFERLSALGGRGGYGLGVYGDYWGDDRGRAFGVKRTRADGAKNCKK